MSYLQRPACSAIAARRAKQPLGLPTKPNLLPRLKRHAELRHPRIEERGATFKTVRHGEAVHQLHAAYNALRPGGTCCIWVYGHKGNELYQALVRPLRFMTTRLPDWALHLLSRMLNVAADIYVYGVVRWRLPLPLADYVRDVFAKLDRNRRRVVIFDQLNPAYAKYYRKDEVQNLFEEAGFVDIRLHHRHGYSWTVAGRTTNLG